MSRSWINEHTTYKANKAKFIGMVFKDFVNEDIREYLINRLDHAQNAIGPENVSTFFDWLKNSVRDKLGLTGAEVLDKTKNMLTKEGELHWN